VSWIEIGLEGGRTGYRPGDEVVGGVAWAIEDGEPPESAEVRLVWFTRGKGDVDSALVASAELPSPGRLDRRELSLRLPEGPYTSTSCASPSEFARLDEQGHVYLDYTGGGLYADVQVRRHADALLAVFGNPTRSNPTSSAATELVERAAAPRARVLQRLARGVRRSSSPPTPARR
jgi:hypothetical protein